MAQKVKFGKTFKWEIEPRDYDVIKIAAQMGVQETNIGHLIGIKSRASWVKIKQDDPEIVEIFEQARSHGEKIAAGVVWDIMNDPTHKQRLAAAMFYLKTKHRWRETNPSSEQQSDLPSEVGFKDADAT